MFATLLGSLPRPPLDDDAPLDMLVEAAVRAQEAAGLDPITDGGLAGEADLPGAWAATQRLTDRAVKQAVTGPYTAGRSGNGSAHARTDATLAGALALNAALRELAAAGCPLIEVHEPAATAIGADDAERSLFREAHLRLLDGLDGTHVSLALTGGNADAAGIETLLAAPYASLAVDLIAGPDNWRLVVATPGDRGIVCGAMSTAAGSQDGPEQCCGRPATPRRPVAAVRNGSASRPRPRWRTCPGTSRCANSSVSEMPRGWPTARRTSVSSPSTRVP